MQLRTLVLATLVFLFYGYWLGGHKDISKIAVESPVSAVANTSLSGQIEFLDEPSRTSSGSNNATIVSKPKLELMDPRWVKMAQHLVKTPQAIERAERAKNQKLDADNKSFLIALGLNDEEIARVIELVHERDLQYNKMTMQLMSEGDMPIETKRAKRKLIDEAQDAKNQEIAKELGGGEQYNAFMRWEKSKPVRDQVAHVARSANLSISPDAEQGVITALIAANDQIAQQGTKIQPESRTMIMAEQIRLHTSNLLSREEQQHFIDNLSP